MDHLRAEVDRLTAVGITGAWMQGPRITFDNLKEGDGSIQHIVPTELFNGARSANESYPTKQSYTPVRSAERSVKTAAPAHAKQLPTMGFGKYKDRLMSEVQETNPGYWRWAMENVGGFEKRARAAGLLEE